MDCTFGGGGYSKELLKFESVKVVAIDRDNHTIKIANEIKDKFQSRFIFHNKKFSSLDSIASSKFDAIIFDLGLSSIQLDNLSRGFSFKSRDELNMMMGQTNTSAKKAINSLSIKSLKEIIKTFGDEEDASKIAKNIVKHRTINQIKTTDELVSIIKSSKKNYKKNIDECTKTFQAIRIFVNKEITELIEGIIKASQVLKPGGKLIIVSFHSIEDKNCEIFFKNFSKINQEQINIFLI